MTKHSVQYNTDQNRDKSTLARYHTNWKDTIEKVVAPLDVIETEYNYSRVTVSLDTLIAKSDGQLASYKNRMA